MIWFWQDALTWCGWLALGLAGIVIWCLVLWGIVLLARSMMGRDAGQDGSHAPDSGAGEILARRLARSEIAVEEYRFRLDALGHTNPASSSAEGEVARPEATKPARDTRAPQQSNHG